MKFTVACLLSVAAFAVTFAEAANLFAGSNLYYAAGLYPEQRKDLFAAMNQAGMKVLRVWLDGENGQQKGTNIMDYPDLEPSWVGDYNDTVLERLDDVMIDAHERGIKLLISMHSWNALQAGDIYDQWYGTGDFYTDSNAQTFFDNRLVHVVNHVHKTLGVPWKELSDYIFAFEPENESMIGNGQTYIEDNQDWQCLRAQAIKQALGDNSGILVTTGGEQWMAESVMPGWLSCEYLDMISIHSYSTGDFETSSIQYYVQQAQQAGKFLIFEEWGACYYTTDNDDCDDGSVMSTSQRNSNIENWSNQILAAGLPWLYWEVLPNTDPHWQPDYEVGIYNDGSWSTLEAAAQSALNTPGAFDFSPYLL